MAKDNIPRYEEIAFLKHTEHPDAGYYPKLYNYNNTVWLKNSIFQGGGPKYSSEGATDLSLAGITGTLNTTSSVPLPVSASESFSDNISLHKISKTGTYSDLVEIPTLDNYVSWNLRTDGVFRKAVTKDGIVDIVAGTNISVVYSGDGIVTITNIYSTPTDEYVDSITFSTLTGVLTLGRNVGADLTKSLDG